MEGTSVQLDNPCFICGAPCVTLDKPEFGCGLVDEGNQLIFLLKNILEVPNSYLEKLLEEQSGYQIKEWGSLLCEDCGEAITSAKMIYEEILTTAKRYQKAKKEIVRKVKESAEDGIIDKGHTKCRMISNFVKIYEYGDFINCFSKDYFATELCQSADEIAERIDFEFESAAVEHGEGKEFEGDPLSSLDQTSGDAVKGERDNDQDDFTGTVEFSKDFDLAEDDNEVDVEYGMVKIYPDPDPHHSLELSEQKQSRTQRTRSTSKTGNSRSRANLTAEMGNSEVEHGLKGARGREKKLRQRDGPVRCKCGKKYAQLENLNRHLKETALRENGSGFICKLCLEGKPPKVVSFTREHTLKQHVMEVHQGIRKECSYCGKTFTLSNISKHRNRCKRNKIGKKK